MSIQNALVTGASSGLGRALAALLVRRGIRVHAAARRTDRLDALREEVGELLVPFPLDVSDAEATHARVRALDEACGGLDLVVANAGIGVQTYGKRLQWEQVRRTLDVNVTGAAATLVGAVPGMVARGRGQLVGISSLAGLAGLPRYAAYSASKAFLATFLEGLRYDLGPLGIAVTTVHPGFVKSEMTAGNRFPMPFLMETDAAAERIWRAIERREEVVLFPWPLATALRALAALPRPISGLAFRRMRG